jgi:hypothetical protein
MPLEKPYEKSVEKHAFHQAVNVLNGNQGVLT